MPRHVTLADCVCEACGVSFQVPASRLRFRPSRFCSRQCLYSGRIKSLEERFSQFIGETTERGCILWNGAVNSGGYGMIRAPKELNRMLLATRVAWELKNGPIPDGLCVLHRCDNPPCINLDRLFLGTQLDNTADRISKGRYGSAKLRPSQVRTILFRHANGESLKQLAEAFGVTEGAINLIVTRKTWKHV